MAGIEIMVYLSRQKKDTYFFVLRSILCNFAIRDGELTLSRHKKD